MNSSGRSVSSFIQSHLQSFLIALAVVAALLVVSIGGTYAYLTHTTNQVSNAVSTGTVEVTVVENGSEVSGSVSTADLGQDSKQVALKNTGTASEYVRVTFMPEVYASGSTATEFTDQTWPVSFTGTTLTLGAATLYFADDWASNWTYDNGTFYSKSPIAVSGQTAVLLKGVTWAQGSTYANGSYTMKVNVIADAIQESAAAQEWGVGSSS